MTLKETVFQVEETDPRFINHVSFADLFSALRNTSVPVKSKASKFYCFVTDTYDSLELGPDIFQFYDRGGIRAAQSQE